MQLSRRHLLGVLASFAASPAVARLGVEEDFEVFRGLVHALGGVTYVHPRMVEACETEFVRAYGLSAWFDLVALAKRKKTIDDLSSGVRTRVADQLRFLTLLLYTGQVGNEVPYYEYALAWQCLDFATAPAQCGGPFGHWTSPHL